MNRTQILATEAQFFASENAERINALRDEAASAVSEFIAASPIQGIGIPPETNPGALYCWLRGKATLFTGANSDLYWHVVDGLAFFDDAVSQNWPYMSLERRKTSLDWAEEHLQYVKKAISAKGAQHA